MFVIKIVDIRPKDRSGLVECSVTALRLLTCDQAGNALWVSLLKLQTCVYGTSVMCVQI